MILGYIDRDIAEIQLGLEEIYHTTKFIEGLGTTIIYRSIWFLGKNILWFCILQMLFEISKSTTKKQQKLCAFIANAPQCHISS